MRPSVELQASDPQLLTVTDMKLAATNPRFKKIYDSYVAFRGDSYLWWQVAEMLFDSFQVRMRART